jgi:hypothetical protein
MSFGEREFDAPRRAGYFDDLDFFNRELEDDEDKYDDEDEYEDGEDDDEGEDDNDEGDDEYAAEDDTEANRRSRLI